MHVSVRACMCAQSMAMGGTVGNPVTEGIGDPGPLWPVCVRETWEQPVLSLSCQLQHSCNVLSILILYLCIHIRIE